MPISASAAVRANVHVQAQAQVQVQAPPPAALTIQPLENAPVPEFFGIPLEGANDVVFVLDVSGSMADAAQGKIATLRVQRPPQPGEARGPAAPAPAPQADPNAPPPATNPPPTTNPPPDPNAPPPAAAATAETTTVGGTKIGVAQGELVEALQRLPVGTRVNVVFFNSEVEAYAPGPIQLDEGSRSGMVSYVWETEADGSTALAPAMRIAFLMNARRIVLLSDGLGNVGGSADDVLRDAHEAIRGGIRIDTIGLGQGQDARLLGTLASESGGLYQAL